jgi:hypothetical protein
VVHGKKGLYAAFIGDRLAVKLGTDEWDPNAAGALDYCFTTALLLLCSCFTLALLLLYSCFTTALARR